MDIPPYPLYNRTYSLYRLSPLHHGAAPLLAARALRTHANRLREQLKGDSVRGVQVDFAHGDDTARLGPLDDCSWHLLGDEDAWIDSHGHGQQHPDADPLPPPAHPRGIEVRLEYESQSYGALLLRDPDPDHSTAPPGFSSLPLLLLKMPGPVRDVFLHYLATAFDAHVAPLRLSSPFITASIETYFRHLSAAASTQTIPDVVRQLSIQLAFPATTTLLKHIDITVAAAHVPGFVARGAHEHVAPFTAALSTYLATHLALDLSHPNVHVSRVSCNTLHLGTDRLKLAAPDMPADTSFSDEAHDVSASQLAVRDFVASLVREAAGSAKFLSEDVSAGLGAENGAVNGAGNGSKRVKSRGGRNRQEGTADEDMDDL